MAQPISDFQPPQTVLGDCRRSRQDDAIPKGAAVIRTLSVSNYRSLNKGINIALGPFTALVGANGSGKSNVADVLNFVRDSMLMGLGGAVTHRNGIGAIRRWSSGHPFNLVIELSVDVPHGTSSYGFELAGDRQEEYRVKWEECVVAVGGQPAARFRVESGRWSGPTGLLPQVNDTSLALPAVGGDDRFSPLFERLKNMTVYSVFPDTLRQPQKYNPEKPMLRHGENWVSILQDQPADTWKPELVSALKRLAGDIEDVKVAKAAGYLVAQFLHTSTPRRKWFAADQESDGTLRVAGIVSALLQQPPLTVVGIEEPELTVHPGALPLLVDFLRQATRQSQVIITTHSPELLDLLEADEVRVVERRDGVTTVGRMLESQAKAVREGLMSLGELMTTEGLQQELDLEGSSPS
jgi:predicted ATPase